MREWVERHETAVFIALTFGIAWPLWLASGTLSRTPVRAPDLGWLVAQLGVFAPAFAGLALGAVTEAGGGRHLLRTLACVYLPAAALGLWIATRGFASFVELDALATWLTVGLGIWVLVWFGADRNRLSPWSGQPAGRLTVAWWSLGCALAPTALFLVAWGLAGSGDRGVGGGAASLPALPVRDLTLAGVLAAFAVNLCFGGSLGEEPGWRGAWLPRLLRRHTPLGAALVIGFWWALWHAPIDLTQGLLLPGVGALVIRQVWVLPGAILFTWVTVRAGGSLLPPLVLHTAINCIPDFALAQPGRYERAAMLFFMLLLVAAFAVAVTDRAMRRTPSGA